MVSLDEFLEMLDEISGEIPREIFEKLNGGVILRPELKYHPEGIGDDLYVMGEYCRKKTMGRYILIYYGSFEKVYGTLSKDQLRIKLRKTLLHEFTHHLESLAGEKDLEIEDAIFIANYKEDHKEK